MEKRVPDLDYCSRAAVSRGFVTGTARHGYQWWSSANAGCSRLTPSASHQVAAAEPESLQLAERGASILKIVRA
jgi:hypothetical protein